MGTIAVCNGRLTFLGKHLVVQPRIAYAICTTPRSGSYLLSDLLSFTGVAGIPQEYFDVLAVETFRGRAPKGVSASEFEELFLRDVLAQGATASGVWGVKLHYTHFDELPKKFAAVERFRGLSSAALLGTMFPGLKHIYLTRKDKVRQAISYTRAFQTDEWWKIPGAEPWKRPGVADEPVYDPLRIEHLEKTLLAHEFAWQMYFHEHGISPLVLCYEELAADPEAVVHKVLDWLGVSWPEGFRLPASRFRKQADATTDEWQKRYEKYLSGGGMMGLARAAAAKQANRAPPAALVGDAALQKVEADAVSPAWRYWVAENLLQRSDRAALVDLMAAGGHTREQAEAELARAECDPYFRAGRADADRLRKLLSLLEAMETSASLDGRSGRLDRAVRPTRKAFLQNYYAAARPVLLREGMKTWRALGLWSLAYFKETAGKIEIEYMAQRNTDPHFERRCDSHRRTGRLAEFVDLVARAGETNDSYLVASNRFFQRRGTQRLLDDVCPPASLFDSDRLQDGAFLWLGPAGSFTPLHHEGANVMLSQVVGRKEIRLISPWEWDRLYNRQGAFSEVDIATPDLSRFPKFARVRPIELVLRPGEMLFVPAGWWYYERSLDVSFTVSLTNFVFPNEYRWAELRLPDESAR